MISEVNERAKTYQLPTSAREYEPISEEVLGKFIPNVTPIKYYNIKFVIYEVFSSFLYDH